MLHTIICKHFRVLQTFGKDSSEQTDLKVHLGQCHTNSHCMRSAVQKHLLKFKIRFSWLLSNLVWKRAFNKYLNTLNIHKFECLMSSTLELPLVSNIKFC